jgi:CRISPR/Cas system-associated exonuclease Cas4 (RecB family)
MSAYLTKYLLKDFVNCPRLFYRKYHHPEAFPSEESFTALNGREFEKLAKRSSRFAGLREIGRSGNDAMALEETQKALEAGASFLAEASFAAGPLFIRADVVEIHDKELTLYEIKSKSSKLYNQKTGALDRAYLLDLTFQMLVLEKAGYSLKAVYLCHPDGSFHRHGAVDPDEFVAFDDVTGQCQAHKKEVEKEIALALQCAESKTEPDHHFNAGCGDCPLKETCFADWGKDNISLLLNADYKKKEDLAERHIRTFVDLLAHPDLLDEEQKIQAEAMVSGVKHINFSAIRGFMAGLGYPQHPLYFLDFETLAPCIPDFDGSHANEIYPTQYSLHKLEKGYGALTHTEFLGDGLHDPRRALAEQLCQDLKEPGKILIYNKGMEPQRVKDMIKLFPDLDAELVPIQQEMVDLMDVFMDLNYYDKAFGPRYTIKIVLPTLCPNDPALNYHALPGSQNGNDAQLDYYSLRSKTPEERAKIRAGLLVYCHLDTFAEVKVYAKLLEEIGDPTFPQIAEIIRQYEKAYFK